MRHTVEMYKAKEATPSLSKNNADLDIANETADRLNDVNNLNL